MITMISFVIERGFDVSASPLNTNIDDSESLSDIDYNQRSSRVDGIPENRWNNVKHHPQHDEFQFSNGMYLGKNDGNYLIIDDVNISQIDHGKRAKVKEVIFLINDIRVHKV